jgi:hypothetical protein
MKKIISNRKHYFNKMKQKASQLCVSVCTGLVNNGDAFSITTPSNVVVANTGDAAIAGTVAANSNVGTTVAATNTLVATCLYDFLAITGARDANGVEADRYCGNALNPAVGTAVAPGSANSIQVCSKL